MGDGFLLFPLWIVAGIIYSIGEAIGAAFEALLPYLPLLILVIVVIGLVCATIVIFTAAVIVREIRRAIAASRARRAIAPASRA